MRIKQEDIEAVKASVSLVDLVEKRLGPPKKIEGNCHVWLCPFHGEDSPSFKVFHDTNKYYCFGCGAQGDAVTWLQKTEGLGFRTVVQQIHRAAEQAPNAVVVRNPASTARTRTPDDKWQLAAQRFVEQCERELWSGHGQRQREYLSQRGLTDETVRIARLGYNQHGFALSPGEWGLPADMQMSSRYVGVGIIIPWYIDGKLWAVNRRQHLNPEQEKEGVPRYIMLRGSKKGLYQIGAFDLSRPLVLVEGEIDALTVHQEAGDLVTVAATGSVSGARAEQWRALLAQAPLVLLAFNADVQGDEGAEYWLKQLPNARRWRPLVDDVNTMHQRNFPIHRWVEIGLKKFK